MKYLKLKTLKTIVFVFALSLTTIVSACNIINSGLDPTTDKSTIDTDDIVKEAKITFKANKVIEIAFASIKGGEEQNMNVKYFSKLMPIAAKYGGKILGSFQVTAVTGGKITPQQVIIFEWPTIASRDKLLADKEAQKLFPVRNSMMTFGQVAYYKVEKDVTISFRDDKIYEFFNAWLTLDAEKNLPKYFKQSDAPKKKYGSPKFLVSLKPMRDAYAENEGFYIHPHMAGIVQWNNTAEFYGLTADPEFKKAKPFLDKSVSRLDMFHTKFNFPQ